MKIWPFLFTNGTACLISGGWTNTPYNGYTKSVLKFKSRPVKKKPAKPSSGLEEWNVVGYSAAESFDLFGIQDALREQQLYTRVSSLSSVFPVIVTDSHPH